MRERLPASVLADKYAPRAGSATQRAPPPSQGYGVALTGTPVHVDDVRYPDMAAALTTLRAIAGENVHARNLVSALANACGVLLDPWDGRPWAKTIRDDWRT